MAEKERKYFGIKGTSGFYVWFMILKNIFLRQELRNSQAIMQLCLLFIIFSFSSCEAISTLALGFIQAIVSFTILGIIQFVISLFRNKDDDEG